MRPRSQSTQENNTITIKFKGPIVAYTHIHAYTHTHTHIHTLSHTETHTQSYTHTHTLTYTQYTLQKKQSTAVFFEGPYVEMYLTFNCS